MPESYGIHEARQIQDFTRSSAANGLSTYIGPVPAGKVWTILSASYNPDVAETKVVHWQVLSRGATACALTAPLSIALSGTLLFPLLAPDAEMKLYQDEYLYIQRDSATAGSAMTLKARVIEWDLPFYEYEEPLNKVVKKKVSHGSVYRTTGGLSTGSGVSPRADGEGGRGARGGREPV
jgi:hypothetical protein